MPQALSPKSENSTDSGESCKPATEPFKCGTVNEDDVLDKQEKEETGDISPGTPTWDQSNAAKAHKDDELGSSSAHSAESQDPHDSGENLQSTVYLSKSGTVHEGAVIGQENEKGTEKSKERSFVPDQADTVKTKKDEQVSSNPNSNDGSGCLSQDPEETKPTAPSSSVCSAAPQENASTPDKGATSDMNQPEPEHLPDVRDIRDCSFQEVIHYLRRVGGHTEREMVKVDAQCLIENLGEENAKKLVTFFNQQSNSMDLVITDGVCSSSSRDGPEPRRDLYQGEPMTMLQMVLETQKSEAEKDRQSLERIVTGTLQTVAQSMNDTMKDIRSMTTEQLRMQREVIERVEKQTSAMEERLVKTQTNQTQELMKTLQEMQLKSLDELAKRFDLVPKLTKDNTQTLPKKEEKRSKNCVIQ